MFYMLVNRLFLFFSFSLVEIKNIWLICYFFFFVNGNKKYEFSVVIYIKEEFRMVIFIEIIYLMYMCI